MRKVKPVNSQSALRRQCWKRDHGRCFYCGLDTFAIQKDIAAYRLASEIFCQGNALDVVVLAYARIMYGAWVAARYPAALWEAHHRTARAEKGDGSDMVTACIPCHRIETAKLLGRQAIRRKRHAYRPEMPGPLRAC